MRCLMVIFCLGAGLVRAQGDGGAEPEDDPGLIIDENEDDGKLDVTVDPFEELPALAEPNEPAPVQVGKWTPPDLDADAERERQALLALRNDRPEDVGVRYRLAEFYLKARWFPAAEAAFLAAADLDPESIQPWEGLLRVYGERLRGGWQEFLQAGGGRVVFINLNGEVEEREQDWLPSQAERDARITHAWSEIVKRRPDDVARRRLFLKHLKGVQDFDGILVEAREILDRLPRDADTRYDLAEAYRRRGDLKERDAEGAGAADRAEARRLLEENVAANPDHAPSALRLARILAATEGTAAEDRITALEERAFFNLYLRPELAPVAFRPDILRMARDLAGVGLARTLWDEAMRPPRRPEEDFMVFFGDQPERPHFRRWIYLRFPNSQPRDRLEVLDRLVRRGDREAAAVLAALLWNEPGPESWPDEDVNGRAAAQQVEDGAIDAAIRLGSAFYPAAERFLAHAEEPRHRRRAARVIRGLKDPRAVKPLLDALAWDTEQDVGYGIAAALEELGDPQAIGALAEAALDVRRPPARRAEAAEALASFRDPRSIEALNRLAKEDGFGLVTAYGLFRLSGSEEAMHALVGYAEKGDERVAPLLAKCEDPRVEEALFRALERSPQSVRQPLIELLRKRFPESSRERLKAILLKEAESPAVSEYTIELLGELGGQDAADRLLNLVESLQGERWAKAARALARTGDERAVRYFSRVRIVDKDPGRRRLASELYDQAAARRAELEHQAPADG